MVNQYQHPGNFPGKTRPYHQHSLNVYDALMKFILLAIFVLFAAQPLPATSCDMSNGQGTDHSQHGNMHDTPMDDGQGMDCCDHDSDEPDDGCDPMSHCGACPVGFAALNPAALNMSLSSNSQPFMVVTGGPPHRTVSPPFRPPIT